MRKDELNEFLEKLNHIDLIDIYSLGILMGVPNNEDFEDYITELLSNFYNRSKPERQAIVELIDDIATFRAKYNTDEDLSVESVKRRVSELTAALSKIISKNDNKPRRPSFLKKFLRR